MSFNGRPITCASPKTTPLNLSKPLPPIPGFDNTKVILEGVEMPHDNGWKSQNVNRVKGVAFEYMFADANETEAITIPDDEDDDSLRKYSSAFLSNLTSAYIIAVPDDMVDDEDDAVPEVVGPSTPQVGQTNHQPRAYVINQALELTGLDMSAVQPDAFLLNAIPTATTRKCKLLGDF